MNIKNEFLKPLNKQNKKNMLQNKHIFYFMPLTFELNEGIWEARKLFHKKIVYYFLSCIQFL